LNFDIPNIRKKIFSIRNSHEFNDLALLIFQFQYNHNPVYKNFVDLLGINPASVIKIEKIPFLPVDLFKTQKIICNQQPEQIIFQSSATTGQQRSKHFVTDLSLYEEAFLNAFYQFYSAPSEYAILALLPSYLERDGSSLIYMTEKLIQLTGNKRSGFYLHDLEKISDSLKLQEQQKQKTILLGVTYALLDLAETFPQPLTNTIIMETGGMKGKRAEMIREDVHQVLKQAFQVSEIHSEYGMTELLSQAYSKGNGIFQSPPWMKILIRDTNDPFCFLEESRSGGINIIDLANLNSCAFLSTQDLGKVYPGGSFEVLGRFDNSDIRGCNLLVQ
jgi:phenylacetate-coenzyme A ligase PaaK-like adenylate-forming protein